MNPLVIFKWLKNIEEISMILIILRRLPRCLFILALQVLCPILRRAYSLSSWSGGRTVLKGITSPF
jgi:hypothetical protein